MNRKIRQCLYLFCIFITGLYGMSEAVEKKDAGSIIFSEDNLVSANLNSVSLERVLESLKNENGINYKCDKEILNEKITISLEKIPVELAFKRLFNRFNYTLVYDHTGLPTDVLIIGRRGMQSDHMSAVRPVMPRNADTQMESRNHQTNSAPEENKQRKVKSTIEVMLPPYKISKEALERYPGRERVKIEMERDKSKHIGE